MKGAARPRPIRASSIAFLAVLLVLGCESQPDDVPITHHSGPLSAQGFSARGTAPPVASAVTFERLLKARGEPQNWLTYYGAYDGQRYSPLDQINGGNVATLRPAWVFQAAPIGLIAGAANFAFEATPIIVDGVMFVSGPDAHVWALDAATGERLWHYHHAIPLDVPLCCGNVNRGVAVANGEVFFATPTGHLIALDATNGVGG
jgi:alcohol dehydrogenase (cytochrome c)